MEKDFEYINSVSQALVEKTPKSSKVLLYTIVFLVCAFFIWAYFAKVDQLVRGDAKVIPYGQNQVVQNYEGGIISKILVEEGDFVKKGQELLKLTNSQYLTNYEKNNLEIINLKDQSKRLESEAKNIRLSITDVNEKEYALYKSNMNQLDSKLSVIKEQQEQKQKERNEIRSKIRHLEQNFALIKKETDVMEPLVKKGIVSKVEFFKLLREANSIKDELESTKISLKRISSSIKEYDKRYEETLSEFQNGAQKELSEVTSKVIQLEKENQAYEDQVKRTSVLAPVSGYIKKMHINTIGGSVQAGMDLVEIVPVEEKLLIETKIKPEDIAFLYEGQKATIKFTAYDFAIYGSLEGSIQKISPDSETDKENNTYYLVYIKANKDYLGKDENALKIKPGMRASADIITGKKSILSYLLKPIIKTKQYALSEK